MLASANYLAPGTRQLRNKIESGGWAAVPAQNHTKEISQWLRKQRKRPQRTRYLGSAAKRAAHKPLHQDLSARAHSVRISGHLCLGLVKELHHAVSQLQPGQRKKRLKTLVRTPPINRRQLCLYWCHATVAMLFPRLLLIAKNPVRGHRTGSNNSGVEEYLRQKKKKYAT